ncbi:MAG: hypothetical protein WCS30_08930 [Selenomonadaceae bacterium]
MKTKKCVSIAFLGVLAIVMLILFGSITLNNYSANFDDLSNTDKKVLMEYDEYCKANANSPIWDGFKLEDKTVLVIDKNIFGNAYLINPKNEVNSIFAKKIKMPEGSSLEVYRVSGFYPLLLPMKYFMGSFNTIGNSYSLLGNEVYFTTYNRKDSVDKEFTSKHFITFLSHEAFHYYMQLNWANGTRFIGDLSEKDLSLLQQEYELLDLIHAEMEKASPSKDTLMKYAKDYVSVVDQRIAANEAYLNKELSMETAEGTATYVGIKASEIVNYDYGIMYFKNAKDVPFADIIPMLESGGVDVSMLSDVIPYFTGAQLCLLFDALQIPNWKAKLNEQTLSTPVTLYSLLKEFTD